MVRNTEWILTKHRVIEKVYTLYGALSSQMQSALLLQPAILPAEVLKISPKISKGEQYEQLPYVVLDYPRFFSKSHVFAIRTFFWWGYYFSSTLHLKGKFQQSWAEKIVKAVRANKISGYYLSTSGNEFDFDLSGHNYSRLTGKSKLVAQDLLNHPFIKLSNKVSFNNWNKAGEQLFGLFQNFIEMSLI